jgi:hypothetical protein
MSARSRLAQRSTLRRFAAMGMVRAPFYANLDYRVPVSALSRDSLAAVEQLGAPLQKLVDNRNEYSEASPFWLGFRQRYPGAWGTVGLTGVAFNENHTQAMVSSDHTCGTTCRNADSWVLNRELGNWRIVERIPGTRDNHWALDSLRYLGVDADPNSYRPRRIRGRLVVAATGRPLPGTRAIAEPGSRKYSLTTDSAGRFSIDNLPIVGWTALKVPCPQQPDTLQMLVALIQSRPGLDSTLDVPIDFRKCIRQRRAHALIAGGLPPQASMSSYPSAEVAAVYRGVLDALYPTDSKAPILLQPYTGRLCDWCFDAELPRLIRQRIVDSSTAASLIKLPKDSAWFGPTFEYRRKVVILSPAEQKFLLDQAEDVGGYDRKDESLTALARDAYPGADSIWFLSRVAFNDAGTQALVQAGGRGDFWIRGETMLLRKSNARWLVVRRHIEREETSGERVGDRCEPADAPSGRPGVSELERFVGDAYVSSVGASPQLRGRSGKMHLRFVPNDTLHRNYWISPSPGDTRKPIRLKGREIPATVQIIDDSTGKPRTGIAGSLERTGNRTTITFMQHREGYITVDGWFEQYHIMKVDGREFFGSWSTQSGPTIPWKGFFCGTRR